MGEIVWTQPQQAAIETTGLSLLVSAGAGSGKTTVLAERCARLLADERAGCGVERILVVTFTDAAASTMRAKIADTLRGKGREGGGGAWVRRQLAMIDAAPISTLHAFCKRLVDRHFALARIDPRAPVLDATEAELLRRESAMTVFEQWVQREDRIGERWLSFLDAYGPEENRVIDQARSLGQFLTSLVDPARWIADVRRRFATDRDGLHPFWRDAWCTALAGELQSQIAAVSRYVDRLATSPPARASADALRGYLDALQSWRRSLGDEPTDAQLDAVCREGIGAYEFPAAPRKGTRDYNGLSDAGRAGFDRAAKLVRDTKDHLYRDRLMAAFGRYSVAEHAEGIARTAPAVRAFLSFAGAVRRQYRRAKRESGVLDFADLERYALRILSDESNGVAARLRDRYEYVLVDEYQDTNPVQSRILELVSREGEPRRAANLFAVGDVKQSIYRFRLAQPRLFVDRRHGFLQEARKGPSEQRGRCIALPDNFRSHPRLIDGMNLIFARLFTADFGGVDYDEAERLRGGRAEADFSEGPNTPPQPVELHVLDDPRRFDAPDEDDGDSGDEEGGAEGWLRAEREAYVVAERIAELRRDNYAYRDIVVLMRAMQGRAGNFVRTLSRLGVPVFAETAGGFFEALEVRDVLSLLAVLDNQRQDIPLAAVLRSPLFGDPLNDSTLTLLCARAGGARGQTAFHEAVRRYAREGPDAALRERVAAIFATLDHWRAVVRRSPLADALWRILDESGYLAYVQGLRDGRQRRENLHRLHRLARQFGAFRRQGLHRFLRFIDELRSAELEFEPGAAVSCAEDAVRIMTIHRSKGQEFPAVIVVEMGKRFNLADGSGAILLNRDLGLGLEAVDVEKGMTYSTLPHRLAARDIRAASLAEELRILYVALTRAQRCAVMVGSRALSALASWRETFACHEGPLPLAARQSAMSPLDWVGQAISCDGSGAVRFDEPDAERFDAGPVRVHTYGQEAMRAWRLEPPMRTTSTRRLLAASQAVAPAKLDESSTAADEWRQRPVVRAVARRLTTPYAAKCLARIPAVAAASAHRRATADDESQEEPAPFAFLAPSAGLRQFRPPGFAASGDELDPRLRGTWTHEFLQHVDLAQRCDLANLLEQMRVLIGDGIIGQDAAEAIDLESVAWFFDTDTGRDARRHRQGCLREWPFVMGVAPSRLGYDSGGERDEIVLVRGIVDLAIDDGSGWRIVDYKTDDVSGAALDERAEYYRRQLEIYGDAVARGRGGRVSGRRLVFLGARKVISQ
jgi:ATP-dependent helicase/nuclease subunit A